MPCALPWVGSVERGGSLSGVAPTVVVGATLLVGWLRPVGPRGGLAPSSGSTCLAGCPWRGRTWLAGWLHPVGPRIGLAPSSGSARLAGWAPMVGATWLAGWLCLVGRLAYRGGSDGGLAKVVCSSSGAAWLVSWLSLGVVAPMVWLAKVVGSI